MSDNIYALVIVAHPDDESFLFAGTTLKLQDEGKSVAVICATRGEKGTDRLNRKLTPFEMAKVRTAELLGACNILRCECKSFFDYPDGELDKVDFDELVKKLQTDIDLYKPQIVMTFGDEGISGHRDHIAICKAVMAASKIAKNKPTEIWKASIPASLADDFSNSYGMKKIHHLHFIADSLKGVSDERLLKINVSKYKDIKQRALERHTSQYVPHLTWPHFFEEECFEVVKL